MRAVYTLLALLAVSFSVHGENAVVFASDTVIANDLNVPVGSTLKINPGVTIKFDGYRTVLVKGVLLAEGQANAPIVFTAVDRDRDRANILHGKESRLSARMRRACFVIAVLKARIEI